MKLPTIKPRFSRLLLLLLTIVLITILIPYLHWQQRWKEDLTTLREQYVHKDVHLNHHPDQAALFNQRIDALMKRLPYYYPDNDRVKVSLLQTLAEVGHLHNSMDFSQTTILPFRLYWQNEKLYVTATSAPYRQVMYRELIEINGRPLAPLIRHLQTVIPHDQEQDLRALIPLYILISDVLHGLQWIDDGSAISLTFSGVNGSRIPLTVHPIPVSAAAHNLEPAAQSNSVLSEKKSPNYSLASFTGKHALYLDYNTCIEDLNYPVNQLMLDMQDSIHNLDINRLIIDLRGNSGGDESLLNPLFATLQSIPQFHDRIIVLVDRQTASSALLHAVTLHDELHAVTMGEPAMGSPNSPGDILPFPLPNSQITVYYCTQEFRRAAYSVLKPDIPVQYTIEDMQQGNDPVLNTALHYTFLSRS
ncbi:hypothetical protein [Paenibacillus sp. Z6-24]